MAFLIYFMMQSIVLLHTEASVYKGKILDYICYISFSSLLTLTNYLLLLLTRPKLKGT